MASSIVRRSAKARRCAALSDPSRDSAEHRKSAKELAEHHAIHALRHRQVNGIGNKLDEHPHSLLLLLCGLGGRLEVNVRRLQSNINDDE